MRSAKAETVSLVRHVEPSLLGASEQGTGPAGGQALVPVRAPRKRPWGGSGPQRLPQACTEEHSCRSEKVWLAV